MPVKNKGSAIVIEHMPPVRKAKPRAVMASQPVSEQRQDTKEMLREIKIRGERLSAEIKELLVRMG